MNDISNEQKLYDLIGEHNYKGVLQLIDDTGMEIKKGHWFSSMDLINLDVSPFDLSTPNHTNENSTLIFDYLTYVYKNQVGKNQFKKDAKEMIKSSLEINDTVSLDILSKHGANEYNTKQLNKAMWKLAKFAPRHTYSKNNFETVNFFLDKGVKADDTTVKHAIKINDKELLHRIILDRKTELSDDFIKSLVNDNPKHQYALELIGKALLNKKLETETCKPKQKQQLRMKI